MMLKYCPKYCTWVIIERKEGRGSIDQFIDGSFCGQNGVGRDVTQDK